MKIGTKLLVTTLAISLIPVVIIGSVALWKSHHALSNQAFSHLESVRELKKAQLENFFIEKQHDIQMLVDMVATNKQNAYQKLQTLQEHQKAQVEWYFQERLNELNVLSKSDLISQALVQFDRVSKTKGRKSRKRAWQSNDKKFGPQLKRYQEKYGYYDLYLINNKGNIVYTVAKKSDVGQNLRSRALKDSPLNKAFQKGSKEIALYDFEPYAPANNQSLAFLTAPILSKGKRIGVLALSLSPNSMNTIVQKRERMGQTGETYLVGQLNGQTSYRSNRVVNGKGQPIIGYPKSGEDINKALAGQSGIAIQMNSTGRLELGAYAPVQIQGLNWCIITTIALEELLAPKRATEEEDFFTRYINLYGYYDLFLIHPEGTIFYTVKHEADYAQNILTGEYADSPLVQLVQEVLQSKTFGMTDYAPYAPSNNNPSAFIAQPLLHNDKVELIVAVQLDETIMNKIMLQRAGMGDSGETYLVGNDKLMRSNSYLAPDTHSIIASFANPAKGMVNTDSSNNALAGESGDNIIKNYRDDLVLSAYTPVKAGDKQWALVAEINQAEAFAPIKTLEWFIGIILLFSIPVIIGIALWLTHSITQPLNKTVEVIKQLANGKFNKGDGDISKKKTPPQPPFDKSRVVFPFRKRVGNFFSFSFPKNDEMTIMLTATQEMSETLQRVILDIQSTVSAAKRGDLTLRVETQSLKGFMKELGDSTNQLVITTSMVMEDMTRVMSALAEGRLDEKTKGDYEGIYAQVSTSSQITIENLDQIIKNIQEVVDNASRGELETLINLYNKQGFNKDLSQAVNALVEIQKNFSNDIGILLENLKNGDFTQTIQTEYAGEFDRIKQNANSTIEKLISTLSQLSFIADVVNQAATKIENGNKALSLRTEEQATFLEETAASMEEMTSTVEQNAKNAKTANKLAISAVKVAKNSDLIVNDAVDMMRQVSTFSDKISDIVSIINGIAFKTKILALNAAIEAAHAGEQGRGFAVVAAEVRQLAQRSAEAGKEINALIEESVSNIETGTILIEQAGDGMHNIITSIGRVTDMMSEISGASTEQSEGIKQINTAIVQMDQMTQQNAALVEETATNAQGLAQQATKLTDAFGQFKFN